ncbi:lipoprotein-releasing ABC transporter ATP-binding protein LolD [Solemya velum gill symbiont]|uniref:Lipoprotein-releasing system ATP-binding protein LolD n=1 Tax=Solemya velum gill symbiont TaxID=2340 RepID=A0A0B0HDK2_SOVGS|nr:lipoprotein-releasing ABC transporter ATP-binding protein LolD [Solemya velum gill symbiont]KHF25989.1 ABC-type antimicrobial peptide transport system, ATPase component [Solemya velum gill symbiont]OOY51466.1 lipoprotein releasing system, ATP-binding protein [Solemya velum gill symbiont]OOY55408.1 lipoprotein releasing system, ATP-binding protein [Solemya velum gill symbiont]OOY56694.1 lipoprotein releasing system, ATP-binding protein [Solemya velum gill symbiont]OOY59872.1 lipoprotein rele
MSDFVLQCRDLHRSFIDGDTTIEVLKGVNLELHKGECIAIIGSSGSGKSTLLHSLGGLDQVDEGEVSISGVSLAQLRSDELNRLRNRELGFIYQFHHLLAELTALENVAVPLLIRGLNKDEAAQQAREWLSAVEMEHRLTHRPAQLSGGERQRVAIARAFCGDPVCIMADEPTGNLDEENAERIVQLMLKLAHERNTAFVIVTHDRRLAQRMDRIYRLTEGRLLAE